jgi:hypothetical protein
MTDQTSEVYSRGYAPGCSAETSEVFFKPIDCVLLNHSLQIHKIGSKMIEQRTMETSQE